MAPRNMEQRELPLLFCSGEERGREQEPPMQKMVRLPIGENTPSVDHVSGKARSRMSDIRLPIKGHLHCITIYRQSAREGQ